MMDSLLRRGKSHVSSQLKFQVAQFISAAHIKLHFAITKDADPELQSLNVAYQIHNILSDVQFLLRNQNFQIEREDRILIIVYKKKIYEIRMEKAKRIVIDEAHYHGLFYRNFKSSDKDYWYGIARGYLILLKVFMLRLRELCVGRLQFLKENISRYGLDESHEALLEGISYPPEIQDFLAPILGPMTSLLDYIQTPELYCRNLKEACSSHFEKYPFSNEILRILKLYDIDSCRFALKTIADLALVNRTRKNFKMAPPPNWFALYFHKIIIQSSGKISLLPREEINEAFFFNGLSMFKFYNWICDQKFKISCDLNESEAKQIIFHCCFGTYNEDLGVLSDITDQSEWKIRSELAIPFPLNNNTTELEFVPIRLLKVSKSNEKDCGPLMEYNLEEAGTSCFGMSPEELWIRFRRFIQTPDDVAQHYLKITEKLMKKYNLPTNITRFDTTEWFNNEITEFHKEINELTKTNPPIPSGVKFIGNYNYNKENESPKTG